MGNPKLIAFQLGDEGRVFRFLDLILKEEQYFLSNTLAHEAFCSWYILQFNFESKALFFALAASDLPGLNKEEVKVEVEDDRVLQISGERKVEKEEKKDTWHRVERSSGKFLRRFRLPENAKMDQIKASMENGVLTVTIPKVEVKKPEVKAIEISG
nr:18.1 kDa class I heat shock protein-like [Quercus suber]